MRPLVFALAASCAACMSTEQRAVNQFSRTASCPTDRIEVRDLAPPTTTPATSPPDEIRRDPGRLAVWTAARDEDAARATDRDADFDWYTVRGCDQHRTLKCRTRNRRRVGDGFALSYADCYETTWLGELFADPH